MADKRHNTKGQQTAAPNLDAIAADTARLAAEAETAIHCLPISACMSPDAMVPTLDVLAKNADVFRNAVSASRIGLMLSAAEALAADGRKNGHRQISEYLTAAGLKAHVIVAQSFSTWKGAILLIEKFSATVDAMDLLGNGESLFSISGRLQLNPLSFENTDGANELLTRTGLVALAGLIAPEGVKTTKLMRASADAHGDAAPSVKSIKAAAKTAAATDKADTKAKAETKAKEAEAAAIKAQDALRYEQEKRELVEVEICVLSARG